jgi:hypothetical protein
MERKLQRLRRRRWGRHLIYSFGRDARMLLEVQQQRNKGLQLISRLPMSLDQPAWWRGAVGPTLPGSLICDAVTFDIGPARDWCQPRTIITKSVPMVPRRWPASERQSTVDRASQQRNVMLHATKKPWALVVCASSPITLSQIGGGWANAKRKVHTSDASGLAPHQ